MADVHKCERCGTDKDVSLVSFVIGGKRTSLWLCSKCMDAVLVENQLGSVESKAGIGSHIEWDKTCSVCGRKWSDFLEDERLGCPECYETFAPMIEQILDTLFGTGKNLQPNIESDDPGAFELTKLRYRLKEAVEREDFELAAKLRDRITQLKGKKQ